MLVLTLFLCRFNLLYSQLSLKGTPLGLALNVHLRRDVHFIESGSFYVSGKLSTYPSPKLTLTLSSYLEQNVGLGEG